VKLVNPPPGISEANSLTISEATKRELVKPKDKAGEGGVFVRFMWVPKRIIGNKASFCLMAVKI